MSPILPQHSTLSSVNIRNVSTIVIDNRNGSCIIVSMPARGHDGYSFEKDAESVSSVPPMLIEEIMYDESAWMLASDPGIGKSILALQIAMALSCGGKLFNAFQCVKAVPVYYLFLEGSYRRFALRFRQLKQTLPYNPANLFIDEVEGLNLVDEKHSDMLIDRIHNWKVPGAIIFDSMYMALPGGGLVRDEIASAFATQSTYIMRQFRCCNIFLHHTHRSKYSSLGKKIVEDDRFYGSQFIKAHTNVSYEVTQEDEEAKLKPLFTLRKDNEDCVRKSIQLRYHPEDMTCTLSDDAPNTDALGRIITFLKECKRTGKDTTFQEVCRVCCISRRYAAYLRQHTHIKELVNFVSVNGKSTLWKMK